MAAEFYEQRIENIVRKIEKYTDYIEERKLTIHMLRVSISEKAKQQCETVTEVIEIIENEKKVQREIGFIKSQIEHFRSEIETLREKQYYLIEWKNKCCGCEHCNPPKTSASVKAAACERLNKIIHKLEK